jgi:molecular chaperone GrpE
MSSEQLDTKDDGAPQAGADTVEALQREREELRDRLLRGAAEFDNYRKRTDRERRDLSDAVSADLMRDLLPVVDDLERALTAARESGASAGALRSGVELIHRQLLDVMRRRGVEPFESVGQDFDPGWHEAIASEPADGHRDGEVVAELRRGYRLGPRLLRPAQVRVAKA